MELSLAPIARIIKSAGGERASKDSKLYLASLLEEYASKIAGEAVKLCEYAGRETISAEDIRLAAKRV
ncbi:MAG: NFYB/HAP3 family transcription factor subunit [Candidatus Thermoplasmatota archaeon]|nr:NFYB/HAP3 family transcription factor subunit [Candidatus Thermoplasmatota archaeon]MDI6855224.1 NFYB/HAP3 family transcription factor subunit [Candidatus Thermoplasmatota archaeon]MDI6887777.1 NFYB/HAP3 family transcription factor subunit [Candidatus Thermoplasmatota archaeon]